MYGGNESRGREIMKKINLIKLLSVLLCAVIVLAACETATGNGDSATTGTETEASTETRETEEQTTEAETETETRAPVEPVLENFLGISSVTRWDNISTAERIDGEVVDVSDDDSIMVVRTADVDIKNIVTEKFTVYNATLKKVVLTVENKYSGSERYDDTFDFDNVDNSVMGYYGEFKLSESIMKADVVNVDGINVIRVSRAALTPIDKEELKDNDYYGYLYEVDIDYDFYDIAGTKIITTKYDNAYGWGDGNSVCIDFLTSYGYAEAVFNADSMRLVRVTSDITGVAWGGFDAENDNYVYYLNGDRRSALGYYERYIDVYSKTTGERVIRHYCEYADDMQACVLENGNVLIIYVNTLDTSSKEPADIYDDNVKYTYKMQILNVKNGKLTDVDLDYVIIGLLDRDTLEETLALRNRGITLTENVINVAVACPIKNKQLDITSCKLLFVDNNMDIMFEMESIVPEHRFGSENWYDVFDLGFEALANGDYLVSLYDVVQSQAIVKKDGTVRSYLTSDCKVIGNYVVSQSGVYDYDMKLLYKFGTGDGDYKLADFTTGIGDHIIVKKEIDTGNGESKIEYFKLEFTDGGENSVTFTKLFKNDAEIIEDVSDNASYVITKNEDTELYSLYNAELKLILKAEQIQVFESDGGYVAAVEYHLDGEDIIRLYTLK